jgi:hypothetical protein
MTAGVFSFSSVTRRTDSSERIGDTTATEDSDVDPRARGHRYPGGFWSPRGGPCGAAGAWGGGAA